MDLTSETPLTELPGKERVDQAVSQRIGTQHDTTIHASHGPTAIGNNAQASDGINIEEAIRLLDAARSVAADEVADGEDKPSYLKPSRNYVPSFRNRPQIQAMWSRRLGSCAK